MMTLLQAWTSAIRPRTLFLALGTTICGSGLAYKNEYFSWLIFLLTTLLAVLMQVLSNLANDLGDFQQGTDTTGKRIGPARAVQSGAITPSQMKTGIAVIIILSIITGLVILYLSLSFLSIQTILICLLIGLLCIVAAIKYTAGKKPYGYKGLGDVFSFLFFGPVPVVGTYFLQTHQIDFAPWLPAIALGLLSAAVLNINNMRDMENDKASNKITIPVRFGIKKAKLYHSFLIVGAIVCFITYNILYSTSWINFLYSIIFALLFFVLYKIIKTTGKKELDPYLKYTSMTTFFLSVFFSVCINL